MNWVILGEFDRFHIPNNFDIFGIFDIFDMMIYFIYLIDQIYQEKSKNPREKVTLLFKLTYKLKVRTEN